MIIDSPIISGSYAASGSLNQFGNVTITGSLTVTGPIIGALTGSVDSASFATTASYVSPNTQINTASFAVTSSYASTVDYNNTVITSSFAITASYVSPATQINTASFAITASYVSPATQINTSSFAITSSYAANAELLDGLDSSAFTPINSFNSYTSSNNATVTSVAASTALALASIATLTSKTGSYTLTSSFNSYTSSNDATVNCVSSTATAALVGVAALSSKTGSYATTGSNTFDGGQYFSSLFNPTGFTTTASLYTDGGLRVTKDAYISGTLYLNNVTVFGTQSVAYITSSQLNIGTNLITVNTDTPSVRFGGLAVYDSGSSGLTGSMLWDSQNNHWVYSNPSGSTYSGGMFISGPRSAALGSEQGTTSCMLLAGQGGDHLTSSMIYHSSTVTCIPTAIVGGSTACFVGNTTLGGALQVAGQQAAENYGGTGLNFDFTSGNVGRIASVKTTSGGSSLELHTYNTSGGDITALNIGNTGVACFSNQICAQGATFTTTGNTAVTIASGATGLSRLIFQGTVGNSRGFIDYDNSTCGFIIRTNENTALTISNTSAACFSSSVTATSYIATGLLCSSLIGANTSFIDNASGTARFLSYGPNSTTRGGFNFFQASSTNASQQSALAIDNSGVSCFSNTICAPVAIFSGCVGIGTTSPTSKLNVSGDNITVSAGYGIAWSGDQTRIMTPEDNVAGALIRYGSGAAMRFVNGSTEHMRINGNGNVGIGTASPQSTLHLCTVNTTASIRIESACDQAGIRLIAGVPGTGRATRIDFLNGATCVGRPQWTIINDYNQNGTNALSFVNCDPTTRVIDILQNGNIGIGTNSPTNKLEVDGGSSAVALRISTTNTSNGTAVLVLANSSKAAFNDGVKIAHGGGFTNITDLCNTNIMTWDMSNTRVGIGTVSPSYAFDVCRSVDANFVARIANPSSTGYGLYIQANDNTKAGIRIANASGGTAIDLFGSGAAIFTGCVGIGTTSPTAKLTINDASTNTNTQIDLIGSSSTPKGHIGQFSHALYLSSNWYYNGNQNNDCNTFGQANIVLAAGTTNTSTISFALSDAGATSPSTKMIMNSAGVTCFIGAVCTPYVSTNTIELGGTATSPTSACVGYGMFGYSGVGLGIVGNATGPNQGIGFFVCGVERGRWISSGNLGVGTLCPGARLQIRASASAGATDALYVENSSSTGLLQVRDDGLIYMKGCVGINETSPSSMLHFSKQTTWGTTDNRIININNTGTGGNINVAHNMGSITWYSGNSTPTAEIAAYRNTPASGNNIELRFYTATAGTVVERLRIDSLGNVIPGANGTQDLGSSTCRWCTVYTSDLSLNNGIGNYTIVEGENDLFLYNNNSCKVFKFLLQEVCPGIAPAKRSI